MLQFKHRTRYVFGSCSGSQQSSSTSSLESPTGGPTNLKEVCQVSFILKQAHSKLGFTHYIWRKNKPKFSFISWFPSPTPDLFEVAPCSTLLPIPLPSPYTGSLQSRSLNQSLLPYHCLPPSLTSTRVLIGRVDECLRIK